jgi:hypothetical protein
VRSREKVGGRWQVAVKAPDASPSSGTRLTFTRRGVEVFGWYDHFVGVGEVWALSWDELDEIRRELRVPAGQTEGANDG